MKHLIGNTKLILLGAILSLGTAGCGHSSSGASDSKSAPAVPAPVAPAPPVQAELTFHRGATQSCYLDSTRVLCWSSGGVPAAVATDAQGIFALEIRLNDICFTVQGDGLAVNPGPATYCLGNGNWDSSILSAHVLFNAQLGSNNGPIMLTSGLSVTETPNLYANVGLSDLNASGAWLDPVPVTERVTCILTGGTYVCPEVTLTLTGSPQ